MGNTKEILEMILQIGIQNLPTLTVCACLWVMVNKRDNERK